MVTCFRGVQKVIFWRQKNLKKGTNRCNRRKKCYQ